MHYSTEESRPNVHFTRIAKQSVKGPKCEARRPYDGRALSFFTRHADRRNALLFPLASRTNCPTVGIAPFRRDGRARPGRPCPADRTAVPRHSSSPKRSECWRRRVDSFSPDSIRSDSGGGGNSSSDLDGALICQQKPLQSEFHA